MKEKEPERWISVVLVCARAKDVFISLLFFSFFPLFLSFFFFFSFACQFSVSIHGMDIFLLRDTS